MENTAKALQMAAGILMSVLVLGLLVYGYNNIAATKKTEQQVLKEGQAADFNKSFETYNRNLQGTELIALSNKVDDYNKRYKTEDGYTEIDLKVEGIPATYLHYKETTRTLAENHNKLESNIKDIIENNTYESIVDGKKYTLSDLSKLNDTKLRNLGFNPRTSLIGESIFTKLNEYEALINERKDFARENFQCDPWEYEPATGRITKIKFHK